MSHCIPIRISEQDRAELAEWLADVAYGRADHAVDALADARWARVTRHSDGRLTYEGRVVLVTRDGVQDVLVSIRQGAVQTHSWQAPTTLPDPSPPVPERTHDAYAAHARG